MNILSLFDGISGCQVALNRAGIKYDNYYASEIDKYAIQITQKNYPNTIQIGSILDWKSWDIDYSKIGLLVAGFPCPSWSIAGKQKGIDDPRGALVHDLIAVWNKVKKHNPNVKFLFENVKMKKEFMVYLNGLFGVEGYLINSALVSAQSRNRYYWSNLPMSQPKDKGILLKDIVHENVDVKYNTGDDLISGYKGEDQLNSQYKSQANTIHNRNGKSPTLCAGTHGYANGYIMSSEWNKFLDCYIVPLDKSFIVLDKEVERGKVGYFRKDSQANRVYHIHNKGVTLCGQSGGGAAKMGQYLFGCITPDRINKRQNGQRFNEGNKFYTLTSQDRHGVLTDGYIRKLTPIECERLQQFPDNFTEGISNTQRYKALGNSFSVDVIAHILKGIK